MDQELIDRIEQLLSVNPNDLLRLNKDSFKFPEIEPFTRRVLNDLRYVLDHLDSFSGMATSRADEFFNTIRETLEPLERLKNFNPDVGNPNDETNLIKNMVQERQARYDDIVSSKVRLNRVEAALDEGTIDANRQEIAKLISEAKAQSKSIKKTAEEVEQIKNKADKTLAQKVESSYGKVFIKRSEEHKNAAAGWLKWMAFAVTAYVILAAFLLYEIFGHNESTFTKVELFKAIVKLAALGAGLYVIQILNRNYVAHKHLEIVNEHRGTVFSVINDLTEAPDNKEIKDALIAYGAMTIFDAGETGYISRNYGAGSDDSSSTILNNLLDSAMKGKQ